MAYYVSWLKFFEILVSKFQSAEIFENFQKFGKIFEFFFRKISHFSNFSDSKMSQKWLIFEG